MKPSLFIFILALSFGSALPALAAAVDTSSCPITMALAPKEYDAIRLFHSRLSHLQRHYGRDSFEPALEKIVKSYSPQAQMIQVSASFFERAKNLVDQARLRHGIALTVGLDHPLWIHFEKEMKKITLMEGYADMRRGRFEKQTESLYKAIRESRPKSHGKNSREAYEFTKTEAIFRVSLMFNYLMDWSGINRGLIDERAEVAKKRLAIIAVGSVGAGVLIGTFVVSGPLVAAGGTYAGALSTNPVVSALLVKVGETAGGALLGVVGAPAAQAVMDANGALSEAGKQSANLQTSYACELNKQIKNWKAQGAGPYLSAALYGGGLGLAGGALTISHAGAKVVLYATGFGVGVAQLYTLGKMSNETMVALAYFRLAQEAEDAGEHDKALELLYLARDYSQKAKETALETAIIATLSVYVVGNFRQAMTGGEQMIRTLYANSADTLPLAGQALIDSVKTAADRAADRGSK